ncbi:MAG: two-component regulator propeller domain-containing protein [Bacteroidota bacterium]
MKKILILLVLVLINSCSDDPAPSQNNTDVTPVEQDTAWKIFTQTTGLPTSNIVAVATAEDSTVWVGTSQGLSRFDGKNWKLFNKSITGKPTDNITCLLYHNGILWVGTPANGLLRYDGNQWLQYNEGNSDIPGNKIIAIDADNTNNIWIAASKGVGRLSNGLWWAHSLDSMHIISAITSITAKTPLNIAVGTQQNGVVRLRGSQWEKISTNIYSTNAILSVASRDSTLWLGTDFRGIFKYTTGNSGTFFNESNSVLPSNYVQLLKFDKDGRLWIGAGKGDILGGLAYNIGSVWKSYVTTNSKLPDNIVQAIDVDNRGYAWIGTRKGLARLKI